MSTTREPRTTRAGATSASKLSNTRARLVGTRTGVLADLVVVTVRFASRLRDILARGMERAGSVITPLGWTVLAGAPSSLGLGYGLGWIELVAVGWAGAALAAIAVAYLVGRPRIDVALELPHRRVVAGDEAHGLVTARNPHARRSLATTVEVPVAHGLAELVLPRLRGGAEHSVEVPIPTRRRGVVPIGPVRTVRADPIGLVRRELLWSDEAELIVHPRIIAAPSTSTGMIHDLEGAATRDLSSSDLAFHALREYQQGDERRYIHWKSSAKTGTYMVRQFEQSRRSHLVVALSLAVSDYGSDEEFELAVSVAGSLGVRSIRDARSVTIVVGATTPEFAKRRVFSVRTLASHRPDRLLDDLAVVEQSEGGLPIRDVAHVVADQTGSVSLAFLICGSRTTPAQLRSAANAFALDVSVVAIVCDPEAVPGLRRVAGIDVLSIGFLEDLRTALARSAAG